MYGQKLSGLPVGKLKNQKKASNQWATTEITK